MTEAADTRAVAYRIETPRLVVRCWNPADAPLLKAALDAGVEHLLPWMPWAAQEPTDVKTKMALLRRWRGEFDLDHDYAYGIFDRAETSCLGSTGLHTRRGPKTREIGYWIRAECTRQGLATEAAAALTRVAFEISGVERIEIHCDIRNAASASVPRKLGFMHEATLRRTSVAADRPHDSLLWSMFADEYPSSPAARMPLEAFDARGQKLPLRTAPDG
jgi:RimJ/RimL family protein N-acetyltransferase